MSTTFYKNNLRSLRTPKMTDFIEVLPNIDRSAGSTILSLPAYVRRLFATAFALLPTPFLNVALVSTSRLQSAVTMIKAIIFDCDGVIADTEPLHYECLRKVLAENDILLTERQYYTDYLAFDDSGCFRKAFSQLGRSLPLAQLELLITRKASLFEPTLKSHMSFFPGVQELIRTAHETYPLAIASGARRQEIDMIVRAGGLEPYILLVIAAEDVANGKPHPEAFLSAYEGLKRARDASLSPQECLVIEDSVSGIKGAKAAGMWCLAVTNSYPEEQLMAADLVVTSLQGLSIQQVEHHIRSTG